MKNRKITFITNGILLSLVLIVSAISFFPHNILPIYSGQKVGAIYNGSRENKNISLMFNVYENAEVVNSIIDVLTEKGVKATFFVGGCWADDNAKTLRRIVESGNEIANHGYFHKDHAKLSFSDNSEEIRVTGVVIEALSGVKPTLFAPPSGSFSIDTLKAAEELNYKVIMWSKDTIDWRDSDKSKIMKRATGDISNGDLILMHPKSHTLSVLPELIDFYLENGFSVVTVSQNIYG